MEGEEKEKGWRRREEKSSGTCHQSVKGTEAILNVPWREFNMGSMMLRSQKG